MSPKPVSVGMVSLGCPKNLVDSEIMLGLLKTSKYRVASDINDCDVALINTCAFIEDSRKESIDSILELAELKKQGKIKAYGVSNFTIAQNPIIYLSCCE